MCYKRYINYTSCKEYHGDVQTVLCADRCGKIETSAFQTVQGYCRHCDIEQFWSFTDSVDGSPAESDDDELEGELDEPGDDPFLDLAESLLQSPDGASQTAYSEGSISGSSNAVTFDDAASSSDAGSRASKKSANHEEGMAVMLAWQRDIEDNLDLSELSLVDDADSAYSTGSIETHDTDQEDTDDDIGVSHELSRRSARSRSSSRPSRRVTWAEENDEMGIGGPSEVPTAYMTNLTGRPSNHRSRIASVLTRSILKRTPPTDPAITLPTSAYREPSRAPSGDQLSRSSTRREVPTVVVSGIDARGNATVFLPSGVSFKVEDVDKLRLLSAEFAAQDAEVSANLRRRFVNFMRRKRQTKEEPQGPTIRRLT